MKLDIQEMTASSLVGSYYLTIVISSILGICGPPSVFSSSPVNDTSYPEDPV